MWANRVCSFCNITALLCMRFWAAPVASVFHVVIAYSTAGFVKSVDPDIKDLQLSLVEQ